MNRKLDHEHHEIITANGAHYRCLFRHEAGGGYRVTCTEMPPVAAFGNSLEEARENAREDLIAFAYSSKDYDDPFHDLRASWRAGFDR